MNSMDGPSLETMDRLSTNTLKRHPKVDLNKNDLLRLLSYLEGELQARDISIATLKTEQARHLLYQAKYGRFGLNDPFLALQRDFTEDHDDTFTESSVKILYDNQLMQLENLIETQKKAQFKMQDQLANLERKYHKVLSELEDEKRKHAQDTAQGDDVTYMLEKERGRLKQELDFEKSQRRKFEKDLKKASVTLEEEKTISQKHKEVALGLIREKKELFEKLLLFQERNTFLEKQVQNWGDSKDKSLGVLTHETSKLAQKMEAAMEKQLSDFDIERERLSGKLNKEMEKNSRLLEEIESLKRTAKNELGPSVFINRSSFGPSSANEVKQISTSNDGDGNRTHFDSQKDAFTIRIDEQNKPTDNVGDMYVSPSGSSREISTGQLTFASNVSRLPPSVNPSSVTPRKGPAGGRGIPPPIPPNKPQITIPQMHRKDLIGTLGDTSGKSETTTDNVSIRSGKNDSATRLISGVHRAMPPVQPIKSSDIPVVQSVNLLKRDT